eukprot:CAMPEP_0194496882 /NCGR_PEP_ID=MMETSP0253-20130528/14005_1 /TAXON_ID=2966 /ORGANISM="Noctiluca scintillans" /LENGTH=178 /DNA_ID=CAMNT_0039338333 /DNA_START=102 /DNA_END=639 /DNA_ORIENTATION=+
MTFTLQADKPANAQQFVRLTSLPETPRRGPLERAVSVWTCNHVSQRQRSAFGAIRTRLPRTSCLRCDHHEFWADASCTHQVPARCQAEARWYPQVSLGPKTAWERCNAFVRVLLPATLWHRKSLGSGHWDEWCAHSGKWATHAPNNAVATSVPVEHSSLRSMQLCLWQLPFQRAAKVH